MPHLALKPAQTTLKGFNQGKRSLSFWRCLTFHPEGFVHSNWLMWSLVVGEKSLLSASETEAEVVSVVCKLLRYIFSYSCAMATVFSSYYNAICCHPGHGSAYSHVQQWKRCPTLRVHCVVVTRKKTQVFENYIICCFCVFATRFDWGTLWNPVTAFTSAAGFISEGCWIKEELNIMSVITVFE